MTQQLSAKNISTRALDPNIPITFGDQVQLQLLHQAPGILRIQTAKTTWLLLADADSKVQRALLDKASLSASLKADILWWNGGEIVPELLDAIKPTTAIASTLSVTDTITDALERL